MPPSLPSGPFRFRLSQPGHSVLEMDGQRTTRQSVDSSPNPEDIVDLKRDKTSNEEQSLDTSRFRDILFPSRYGCA